MPGEQSDCIGGRESSLPFFMFETGADDQTIPLGTPRRLCAGD